MRAWAALDPPLAAALIREPSIVGLQDERLMAEVISLEGPDAAGSRSVRWWPASHSNGSPITLRSSLSACCTWSPATVATWPTRCDDRRKPGRVEVATDEGSIDGHAQRVSRPARRRSRPTSSGWPRWSPSVSPGAPTSCCRATCTRRRSSSMPTTTSTCCPSTSRSAVTRRSCCRTRWPSTCGQSSPRCASRRSSNALGT